MLVHRDSQSDTGTLDVRPTLTPAVANPLSTAVLPKADPLPPVTVGGKALWTDPRQ